MKNIRKSEILTEAKSRLIKDIKEHKAGICAILVKMRHELKYKTHFGKLSELQIWIMDLLNDHTYYDLWLKGEITSIQFKRLIGKYDYEVSDYDHSFAHEGRLQWLDWMIEIHKEMEDIADGITPKTRHINFSGSADVLALTIRYKVKK